MNLEIQKLLEDYSILNEKPHYIFKDEFNNFNNWIYVIKNNSEYLSDLPEKYNNDDFFKTLFNTINNKYTDYSDFFSNLDINLIPIKFLLNDEILMKFFKYKNDLAFYKKLSPEKITIDLIKKIICLNKGYYFITTDCFKENMKELLNYMLFKGESQDVILKLLNEHLDLFTNEEFENYLDEYFLNYFNAHKNQHASYADLFFFYGVSKEEEPFYNKVIKFILSKINDKNLNIEVKLNYFYVGLRFLSNETILKFILDNSNLFITASKYCLDRIKKHLNEHYRKSQINENLINLLICLCSKDIKFIQLVDVYMIFLLENNLIQDIIYKKINNIKNDTIYIKQKMDKSYISEFGIHFINKYKKYLDILKFKEFFIKNFDSYLINYENIDLFNSFDTDTIKDLSRHIVTTFYELEDNEDYDAKSQYLFKNKKFIIEYIKYFETDFIKDIILSYSFEKYIKKYS